MSVLTWKPLKAQEEFLGLVHDTDDWAIAFIGGFGSGKSEVMHWMHVTTLLSIPGVNTAIYAPTYDLIKLNNQPRIAAILDQLNVSYNYNKQDYIFTVRGYGNIIFRSLDAPHRIIGYETYLSSVDEGDTIAEAKMRDAWNKVIARNRQQVPGCGVNKTTFHCTPEGYGFAYKMWDKEDKEGYVLVRGKTRDNTHLSEQYIRTMVGTYDERLQKAYLEGEFVNLTGNAAYYAFDRDKSCIGVLPKATLQQLRVFV